MGTARPGRKLRLKKTGHKETMGGRFDGPDLALWPARHHRESGFDGRPLVVRIDLEIAEKLLGDRVPHIERLQVRAGAKANLRNRPGKFGRILVTAGNSAGDRTNDDVL